ncbi:MAG: NACHT domain-containing protein, partial [Leptolyngbya sp. SIO3F4]|nr:NACHT domain-containing protein [Leptolyngbya sp. SIO3F4]
MSPSGKPKPPINEQIAEIIRKVSMPGGITLGGVGALWHYFVQSDVPKTIASAVIGVLISYGAKMLGPIHERNQKAAEKAGKAAAEQMDRVEDQLVAAARGFEKKYLLCQASECQALRSEGVPPQENIFVPLLTEVFVPLELDSSSIPAGYKEDDFAAAMERRDLRIWDFLAKAKSIPAFRQMAVLAWGGYGKTTLLKHITFRYGTGQTPRNAPKLVPVLLILRDYRDVLSAEDAPDLEELITQHHIPDLAEDEDLQPPKGWAKTLLRKGRALVMFDGFDEVGTDQRPAVAKWLMAQMNRYSKSVFLVTSRPKAYREQTTGNRFSLSTSLWVRDFSAEQREQFVTRWYSCQERYANAGRNTRDVRKQATKSARNLLEQIEKQDALKDLAKNPLLLSMIVTFHRQSAGADLPKRKVELYREICRLQLVDRPRARGVGQLITQCEAQKTLQQIAFAMMQRHWERIPRGTLLKGLAQILKQQDETFKAQDFLEEVVQISELLVQQEDDYEFAHLSFQEYLAAVHVASNKKEQLLHKHFDDDWWKPTILLYGGLVNPTTLIREAVKQGATDLAYQCLQETTKQVDPKLAAELQVVKQTVA